METKKKIIIAFVILFILGIALTAVALLGTTLLNQNTTTPNNLEIAVYDTQTLYSLPNTKIQLYNQQQELLQETTTNEKGIATFTTPNGNYYILAQREGYEQKWQEIQLQQKQVIDLPLPRLNL